jgi:1,5-anhydro-D-fructose reductase (1,5-anhydro-D-mannitol-forming)
MTMPADHFGWCLVGASEFARTSLAPAIMSQPRSRVISVVSGNLDRAEAMASPLGATGHDQLPRALNDPAVDAVYISSINSAHHAHALVALAAGKHVLCEKPLSLTVDQAEELVEVAERSGLVLGTNHHMRNSAPHELMRRAIAAGDIGEPVAALVQHAVQLPKSAQRWRTRDPDSGAGVALDITVHDADALRFVLNCDPLTVLAHTGSGRMSTNGIDETISGVAMFDNGLPVSFLESFVTGHAPTRLQVLGTEGAMTGEGIQSMKPVGTLTRARAGRSDHIDLGKREDLYTIAVRRFESAVRHESESPAATGRDGVWSLAFATAALRSARCGRPEKVSCG